MYSFGEAAIITGDIKAIWAVATDVGSWAAWDPHEEKARIDGPFAAGTKGWNKPAGAPAAYSPSPRSNPDGCGLAARASRSATFAG